LQTCNVNFAALDLGAQELALTSMAGVSVLVIPQRAGSIPLYRIWCDPSYGPYLYRTLLGIVEELGGGPVGMTGLALLAPLPSASIAITRNP
jgi:sarcosine oxidase subunit gamma